jgi:hypothetical protein
MRRGKKKSEEHLAKFNKSVIEVTTGIVYPSLKDVKEKFEMSPGALARALKSNKPITKGKNAGKHFKYVDPNPDL